MYNIRLIKNYASALYSCAHEQSIVEIILSQLKFITQVIDNNESLKNILHSPIVNRNIKSNILLKLAKKSGNEKLFDDFLLTLTKNSRELILSKIYDCYKKLADKDKNIKNVYITSAQVLNQEDKEIIINYLKLKLIKQEIDVKFDDDPSIIGGILIKYDSNIVDLSILGEISKINKISQ
ncbi:MAG: ATP synthase F1 subunit delta [Janthinobacterium lividum]